MKMTAKAAEVNTLSVQNSKLFKQVEELRVTILKLKKTDQLEQAERDTKLREKDAEIEVLKEMIKGVKVQLKCKYLLLV